MQRFADFEILGLEPRDMFVYDALFKLDNASLRTIAKETGLNRGTVYETIKKLMDAGLVTFSQTGERRRYVAAQPEVLSALIRERHDKLQQLESKVTDYAKALRSQLDADAASYFAHFYEGDQGVASILRDVLQTVHGLDKREYRVISSRDVSNFIYNNFPSFTRQRTRQGIFVKVLADAPPKEKLVLAERRRLPETEQTLNGYVILYGDKTALISLGDANRLSGVVIDDAGITNMQRLVFDQLWRQSAAK